MHLSALGECVGVLTNGADASLITLHTLAKVMEYSVAPLIGVTVAMAYGTVRHPRLVLWLLTAHAAFQFIALPFGWVFWVDEANIGHHGVLYGVYVAAFVFSIATSVLCIIRSSRECQTGADAVLVLAVVISVVGIVIQFLYSAVRIDFLCITISNYLLYSRSCKIVLQLDAVTQLLNRRCYDTALGTLGDRAAVLFFDVNRFKQINDTYGHAVGDLCLQQVGDRLRQAYGHSGACYRIGGDEFCVILDSHLDELEAMNRRFQQSIEELQRQDSRMPDVAMGYAWYYADRNHIQKVIEEADAMMYRNKAALGR